MAPAATTLSIEASALALFHSSVFALFHMIIIYVYRVNFIPKLEKIKGGIQTQSFDARFSLYTS